MVDKGVLAMGGVCLLGVLVSLVTIITAVSTAAKDPQVIADDFFATDEPDQFDSVYYQLLGASMACLMVILTPFLESITDYRTLMLERNSSWMASAHLNPVERMIYFIGYSCLALGFGVASQSKIHRWLIYTCISNMASIFWAAASIFYLHRRSDAWNFPKSFLVLSLLCVGSSLSSVSYLFDQGSGIGHGILIGMNVCLIASTTILFLTFMTWLVRAVIVPWWLPATRYPRLHRMLLWLNLVPLESAVSPKTDSTKVNQGANNRYEKYMPGIHMGCALIVFTIDTYWYISNALLDNVYCSWVLVIPAVMVCYTEYTSRLVRAQQVVDQSVDTVKKSYVRFIQHEIRTPLNGAFLGMKVLMKELEKECLDDNADELRDTASDVSVSLNSALAILSEMLNLDKLQSGLLKIHPTTESILPLLSDALGIFSAQCRESGVRIDLQYDHSHRRGGCIPFVVRAHELRSRSMSEKDDGIQLMTDRMLSILPDDTVDVDRFQMVQVVRNLVSNALKFSPRGSVIEIKVGFAVDKRVSSPPNSAKSMSRKVAPLPVQAVADRVKRQAVSRTESFRQVTPLAEQSKGLSFSSKRGSIAPANVKVPLKGRLIIQVIDQGAGISPTNQTKLFKEVIQFNPEKLQAGGGSGFGLFLCRAIVDMHEGRISVYSPGEGEGTTFTLEVPMTRKAYGVEADDGDQATGDGDDERALICEDDDGGDGDGGSSRRLDRNCSYKAEERILAKRIEEVGSFRTNLSSQEVSKALHRIIDKSGQPSFRARSGPSSNLHRDRESGGRSVSAADQQGQSIVASATRNDCPPIDASTNDASDFLAPKNPFSNARSEDESMCKEDEAREQLRAAECFPGSSHGPFDADSRLVGGVRGLVSEGRTRARGRGAESPKQPQASMPIPAKYFLVVDDSVVNRKMLCKTLRADGHTVVEACNGREALHAVKWMLETSARETKGTSPPRMFDCILMDSEMPEMDGPTATSALRRMGYKGSIVGLTGNGDAQDIAHFEAKGADRVFVKPFDVENFMTFMAENDSANAVKGY